MTAVELGPSGLSARDVVSVAREEAHVSLTAEAHAAMERAAAVVASLSDAAEPAYGISTGFGSLATVSIASAQREELQRAVVRSHAAGMGPPVEREVVRAMMLLRARTLAMGYSGARPVVAERIVGLLNAGLTPVVPEHGSLGASGDLAPLAHCALALIGEGEVDEARSGSAVRPADALASAELEPLSLTRQGGAGADQRHRRDAGDAGDGEPRPRSTAAGRGRDRRNVGRGAARNGPRICRTIC